MKSFTRKELLEARKKLNSKLVSETNLLKKELTWQTRSEKTKLKTWKNSAPYEEWSHANGNRFYSQKSYFIHVYSFLNWKTMQ